MKNKSIQILLNISKIIIILMILVFVVTVYNSTDRFSAASCEEIEAAVLGSVEEADSANSAQNETVTAAPEGSVKATEMEFQQAFGFSVSEFEGVIYYRPVSNMDVTQIVIAKAESSELRKSLVSVLEEHIEKQKKDFEGYAPEQYDLLSKADVTEKDGFVFLAVGAEADAYYTSFYKAVKR